MKHKILAMTVFVMMLSIAAAGCLGGGGDTGEDDGAGEPQLEQRTDKMVEEAWVKGGPASVEDVDVEARVNMNLPASNVASVKFTIQIIDGHGDRESENTNTLPDVLKGERIVGGGGENATAGLNKPIPAGGQNAVVEFRAPEGSYLPSNWEVSLIVTIKASEDQWPGPMIWRGFPDEGFYYIITAEYTFMSEP